MVPGLSGRLSEQKSGKARQTDNSQYTFYRGLSTKRMRQFFFLLDVRTYEECGLVVDSAPYMSSGSHFSPATSALVACDNAQRFPISLP